MGRSRQLCYAVNAERRRRENGEEERQPGLMPLLGRGLGLLCQDFSIGMGSGKKTFT